MHSDPLQRFLRRRSKQDFEQLLRAESARMLAAARRVLGDRALAEDAVQEVFVKLLEQGARPHEIRSGRGWLVARTIAAARARLRAEARREVREGNVARSEEEPPVPTAEAREVREAVFQLPGPLRQCVELRYFGALSAEEIGAALGCARRT